MKKSKKILTIFTRYNNWPNLCSASTFRKRLKKEFSPSQFKSSCIWFPNAKEWRRVSVTIYETISCD